MKTIKYYFSHDYVSVSASSSCSPLKRGTLSLRLHFRHRFTGRKRVNLCECMCMNIFLFLSIACETHSQGYGIYGNLRLIFNDFTARSFPFGSAYELSTQTDARLSARQNILRVFFFVTYFQLEDFKIAQKEQERQIEKEISNRERDINCLKHFRSRCADIVRKNFESFF